MCSLVMVVGSVKTEEPHKWFCIVMITLKPSIVSHIIQNKLYLCGCKFHY